MKISIVHVNHSEERVLHTSIDAEDDSPSALVHAVAMMAAVRFDQPEIKSLLDYKGITLSAAAAKADKETRFQIGEILASGLEVTALDLSQRRFAFDGPADEGEAILDLVHQVGGTAAYTVDEHGVIDEITASFYETNEDHENSAAVLESLQAAGTPHALVGDFAQTSIVGANGQEQVIGLSEWSISWKRKTVETTNTDNALYETSLGSTKSWTAKAKYMFLFGGDQTQMDGILSAMSTSSLVPLTWNFFPNVNTGDAAFQGAATVDGIEFGSGNGKVVGLDVSLKGTGPLLQKVQAAPIANPNTVTGQSAQV